MRLVSNAEPLPSLYESTGQITRFTNGRDPNPRSREVFSFRRPETPNGWIRAPQSLRSGISSLPPLDPAGLRRCHVTVITEIETPLKADRRHALVQMAPGSGKTFAAAMQIYRLLKHASARLALCFLSIPANPRISTLS